jgi:Glycosyltransferase sugar-binding region containing DXD motif
VSGTINGFWYGERLTTMGKLSVASYLANGHAYKLWTYGKVGGVPDGAEICDASQIVPQSYVKQFKNLANFSDALRYRLLFREGGWYVDLDNVCMRPYPDTDAHVLAEEEQNRICGAVLYAPRGSAVMKWCSDQVDALDVRKIRWAQIGPELLTQALQHFPGLADCVKPTAVFMPVHWREVEKFIVAGQMPELGEETLSVHLWSELWSRKKWDRDAKYVDGCFYERMQERYLPYGLSIVANK